ncbi:glycosyltransferase involved in cell wall biosynthesis [Faecalicoccus acidiformans]|uniref:Glycosyltransferase involved in cell wall biosynthesis n=1 Tax=Faecalicoccus acidiformans TaxID=915173 RepID=A0A7W8FZB1_9FIRM|nr:glycosyltransferase family 4 protein [Faecalicoccus acidiformans]MBB5185710.1 glycosyltransferase involved in cell wall biosynthesis [Faecalicoccus acidiformans]
MLKDKNVLFIVRTMGLGGTENVVLQLCEILKNHVNKIVVCSSGGVHEVFLKENGIKHYTIPDIASKKPCDIVNCILNIKRIVKDEKINIIHSHHRMAAFYAQFINCNNIVKIASVHNTFFDKKILTRFAYKNTQIIPVGNVVSDNLKNFYGIDSTMIHIIHNSVKPFNGLQKHIRILNDARSSGKALVGNIGRLSEQKGMSYFIRAAQIVLQKHSNVVFFLVGEGKLKESLIQLAEEKGISKNIVFMGYRDDIQNVISQMDFVVLSSLWEGLPLTPIEAFSVGRTVIGTRVDGTPEIISDGINGYLVEPRNVKELASKICYLLEHQEIKQELEKNAMKTYLEKFSFERMSLKYLTFYQNF